MFRCPFCDVSPFPEREAARDHVLTTHPERVQARVSMIAERTRAHMVNPDAWAAGALLSETDVR